MVGWRRSEINSPKSLNCTHRVPRFDFPGCLLLRRWVTFTYITEEKKANPTTYNPYIYIGYGGQAPTTKASPTIGMRLVFA